jgi:hypothetical protein
LKVETRVVVSSSGSIMGHSSSEAEVVPCPDGLQGESPGCQKHPGLFYLTKTSSLVPTACETGWNCAVGRGDDIWP